MIQLSFSPPLPISQVCMIDTLLDLISFRRQNGHRSARNFELFVIRWIVGCVFVAATTLETTGLTTSIGSGAGSIANLFDLANPCADPIAHERRTKPVIIPLINCAAAVWANFIDVAKLT